MILTHKLQIGLYNKVISYIMPYTNSLVTSSNHLIMLSDVALVLGAVGLLRVHGRGARRGGERGAGRAVRVQLLRCHRAHAEHRWDLSAPETKLNKALKSIALLGKTDLRSIVMAGTTSFFSYGRLEMWKRCQNSAF